METLRIPVIKVRDNGSNGAVHMVGTDSHDVLEVDESGGIHYYNLQNGEGTGQNSDYSFVTHDNGWTDTYIEFVPIQEFIRLCCQHLDDAAEREKKFREVVGSSLQKFVEEMDKNAESGFKHT